MKDLGFIGSVAPFFLKRVYRMEIGYVSAQNRLKVMLRRLLLPVRGLFAKLYPMSAMVELQVCLTCSLVQLKSALPEEWINQLYVDYRSDSYNRERIHYEPSYEAIAKEIGLPQEAVIRVAALTEWLEGRLERGTDFSMLDFGGADGRFLPDLPSQKYVYEISDYAPAPGITRVASESELREYSYVQVAHVLEHVMNPLALIKRVVQYIEPGGYLYVEVPQEKSDEAIQALMDGSIGMTMSVHEHINGYSSAAVAKLIEAAGLELVVAEQQEIDYGYAKWTIVRALGRKMK